MCIPKIFELVRLISQLELNVYMCIAEVIRLFVHESGLIVTERWSPEQKHIFFFY